jgi:hypothetical protein
VRRQTIQATSKAMPRKALNEVMPIGGADSQW